MGGWQRTSSSTFWVPFKLFFFCGGPELSAEGTSPLSDDVNSWRCAAPVSGRTDCLTPCLTRNDTPRQFDAEHTHTHTHTHRRKWREQR